MNERQKRFVKEYLHDFDATAAAARAGYSCHSKSGYRLARRPDISAAIDARAARREHRITGAGERVVEELMRVAFSDIRAYLSAGADGTVTLKPVTELKPHETAAIASLTPASPRLGPSIRLHAKPRALKALARHVGLAERHAAPDPRAVMEETKRLRGRLMRAAGLDPVDLPEPPGCGA